MRNLSVVIDQMIAVIPPENSRLIERLKSVQQSAIFSAPEMMRLRWRTGAEILDDEIPNPPESEWEKELVSIWMDTAK